MSSDTPCSTESTIVSVSVKTKVIALTRPWGPTVQALTVLPVAVTDSDGNTGHGFSWTPSIGGAAAVGLLEGDIIPWALEQSASPSIWQAAWEHIHEAGGGGISTIALAGLDLALWDLACRRMGQSVDSRLGVEHQSQPAYGSGVNLHYSLEELVEQAKRWVAAGFGAIKIKVGKPDVAEDVERLDAVREAIGTNVGLMIDANQRWGLAQATANIERLSAFDLLWMEEPLRSDDTAGYVELRKRVAVPIAMGENVHHWFRFQDLLQAGACDVVQPNIVRVGGITPFLRIVELARDHGVELAPHLLPDLSARLAVTLPETTWVEDVEDAGFYELGALERPSGVEIRGGRAFVEPAEGIGIQFGSA